MLSTSEATSERPILFSGPMVRAILDGRKTQTRRIIKDANGAFWDHAAWRPEVINGRIEYWVGGSSRVGPGSPRRRCPYGKPGDRLWVRETFRFTEDIDGREVLDFQCGGTRLITRNRDGLPTAVHGEHRCTSVLPKFKPSIHMPRWASRIALEVAEVRAERLQEISSQDAWAEGCRCECTSPVPTCAGNREAFMKLWDAINTGRTVGRNTTPSWDHNPWVWVVSFKRM